MSNEFGPAFPRELDQRRMALGGHRIDRDSKRQARIAQVIRKPEETDPQTVVASADPRDVWIGPRANAAGEPGDLRPARGHRVLVGLEA